jgi:mannonate dehydratase
MKLCDDLHDQSDDFMQFLQQLGVECVKITGAKLMPPKGCGVVPEDELRKLQDRLAQHDLTLDIFLLPQGPETQYWHARFGRPERDREIEDVCRTIEVCGRNRIPVVEWTWSIIDVWGSDFGPWGRGGAGIRRYDYEKIKHVEAETGYAVDADTMWERLEYIQDPPQTPSLKGEARIISDFAGMKKLIELVDSPANGLNLCQGSLAEQNNADVLAIVRYFLERDRIYHVHFRNVCGSCPAFDEVFIDEGDVDMVAAMQLYHEFGYQYAMMPDHWPKLTGDTELGHASRAYAHGYMKALMQAVGAKASGPQLKAAARG